MSRRPIVVLLLCAGACRGPTATVRVTIPDLHGIETPVAGMTVTFLPYDRDSLLAAVAARSGAGPRPHTSELDSLFRGFRGPFLEYLLASDSAALAGRRRDSLAAAGDSLAAAWSGHADRLAARAATARVALDRAREVLWPEMDRLRSLVSRWEDSAYRDYRAALRATSGRVFANPVADTTDPLGWATAELTNGRWWVTARSIDPTDPNAEWYWNLPVDRDTVLLDPRTGRRRPRY